MEYTISINNGVEAFGTAGQKTITVNEELKTVDAKFLAHYISLHNPTIPQQTDQSVLENKALYRSSSRNFRSVVLSGFSA